MQQNFLLRCMQQARGRIDQPSEEEIAVTRKATTRSYPLVKLAFLADSPSIDAANLLFPSHAEKATKLTKYKSCMGD